MVARLVVATCQGRLAHHAILSQDSAHVLREVLQVVLVTRALLASMLLFATACYHASPATPSAA